MERCGSPPVSFRGRPPSDGEEAASAPIRSRRGSGVGMYAEEVERNTGSPMGEERGPQPDSREGQAGPYGVAERPVVARKLGNASGAKGP